MTDLTNPRPWQDFDAVPTSAPTVNPAAILTTLDGDGPCADCGTGENIVWFTDTVFWNNVCTQDSPILCLPCFIKRAELRGFRPTGWRVTPEWPWKREV